MTDNPFVMIVRRLQGERRGMGSEYVIPGRFGETFAAAALSPAISISQAVLIPDVSFWEGEIDFEQMKAAGAAGVIIRAGQRLWPDTRFKEYWQKAKAAGLPRGSYWFFDSREDPKKQAALWWSLLQGDPGELVHAADFEESYGGPYGSVTHFRAFVAEFKRLSGLPDDRIAIYTGYYYWMDRTGGDPWFAKNPLWLASYTAASVVRVPLPWSPSDLLLWQYTSSGDGPKYGVSSQEIDLSWYCCSLEHFNNRFHLDEQPTEGGSMSQWYRVLVNLLNLRSTPVVQTNPSNDIGDLHGGDVIETTTVSGSWARVVKIVRRDGGAVYIPTVETWANVSTAYCMPIGDPNASTVTLTHTITTYSDGSVKVDGTPVP